VIRLRLDAPEAVRCTLLLQPDGGDVQALPMTADGDGSWTAEIAAPETAGLLWYTFSAESETETALYGACAGRTGGVGCVWPERPAPYQITVYRPDSVPDWFKDGVIYQIFPDRFARGSDWLERQMDAAARPHRDGPFRMLHQNWDDEPFYPRNETGAVTRWPFFGGTLEGIREKLPYLQSLGVTILYLNPIFRAASNHRYDTGDYMRIDEGLGDEASFRRLAEEAGSRGIRIMLDGVFSHTGADSIYFNRYGNYDAPGAWQGEDSPYYSWYRFGAAPGTYDCWWGVLDLPNVREDEPSYMDFICRDRDSVVRHWLRAGASAWRLDVADELPDLFIREVRRAMRETAEDAVLLGEVWEDASNKISYGERRRYFAGDELQATMHYPFRDAAIGFMLGLIPAGAVCEAMLSIQENYPPEYYYSAMNLIGSHDRARILTVLGDAPEGGSEAEKAEFRLSPSKRELARVRLKALTVLQFASPGVPSIYYGDEAGVEGYEDPFNRGTFPWGREDAELTEHYRRLTALRAQEPALRGGSFTPLAEGEHVYGILRTQNGRRLLALINRGVFDRVSVTLPDGASGATDLLTGEKFGRELRLLPLQAVLLALHDPS